jgi:hypothetical protein
MAVCWTISAIVSLVLFVSFMVLGIAAMLCLGLSVLIPGVRAELAEREAKKRISDIT